jgi:hypothetical protein
MRAREAVDGRLVGVLVALNLFALPVDDLDVMADLDAALDLESLECGSDERWVHNDVFAVWEWAAIAHAAQMAEYRETSPQERLHLLFMSTSAELARLRDEVRNYLDQMCWRARSGRTTSAPWDDAWLIRSAAPVLMEWLSARLVHPAGSSLAERYFIESLAHLRFACMHADVKRAVHRRARTDEIEALTARLMGGHQ